MSHCRLADINQRIFYLLNLSRKALAANRYTDEQLASKDGWQNDE